MTTQELAQALRKSRRAQLRSFLLATALLSSGVLLFAPGIPAQPKQESRESQREALRQRQRPYEGAPPAIPHEVAKLGRRDCLKCHREGLRMQEGSKDVLAPVAPHPERSQCQQCHLERAQAMPGDAPVPQTAFLGVRYPLRGRRMYSGAPPSIPHPLWDRQRCLSCHGQLGGSPVRSPHPERVNCQQCHVTQLAEGVSGHE